MAAWHEGYGFSTPGRGITSAPGATSGSGIFHDDRDRRHFLDLLETIVGQYRLRLYAYILMDNHYHLLAQITEPNLSAAMQWLGDSYTMWFNRRHHLVGHLYQGRFQGILRSNGRGIGGMSRRRFGKRWRNRRGRSWWAGWCWAVLRSCGGCGGGRGVTARNNPL